MAIGADFLNRTLEGRHKNDDGHQGLTPSLSYFLLLGIASLRSILLGTLSVASLSGVLVALGISSFGGILFGTLGVASFGSILVTLGITPFGSVLVTLGITSLGGVLVCARHKSRSYIVAEESAQATSPFIYDNVSVETLQSGF